jgi:hypothetical protein
LGQLLPLRLVLFPEVFHRLTYHFPLTFAKILHLELPLHQQIILDVLDVDFLQLPQPAHNVPLVLAELFDNAEGGLLLDLVLVEQVPDDGSSLLELVLEDGQLVVQQRRVVGRRISVHVIYGQ